MGTLRYSKTWKERSMDRQSSGQKEIIENQDSIQMKKRVDWVDSIDMKFNTERTKKKSRVVPNPYMRQFWGEHIFAE